MIVRQSARGLEVLAPAKVNLFLEIHGRRSDGYHELETLMAAIDLYDVLTFQDDPSGRLELTNDAGLPAGEENLVTKAAMRLRLAAKGLPLERDPETLGARIELRKSIPMGAGLAGGSSDAAATLAALDQLWGLGLSRRSLSEIGAEVGSDVPFFLCGSPMAVCSGRGERVEALESNLTLHFLLLSPPVHLSTASVYRRLTPPGRPSSIAPALSALASGNSAELGASLFNRLQPVAESLQPDLVEVRQALEDHRPSMDGTLMSGSGSSYFGLCRDSQAALDAARRLEKLGLGRVQAVSSRVTS